MKPRKFFTKAIALVALLMMILINVHGSGGFWNEPVTRTQPDGTVINVIMHGDTFNRIVKCNDNFTIVRDLKTLFWCWGMQLGYAIRRWT